MQKLTMPLSKYFVGPIIDFIATKIEIMKRLDENNRLRNADDALKATLPRIGGGIKTTAEKLIQLLIKKFKVGESDGSKLAFTYSYFIQHADGRVQKTALKQHFIRLCDAYRPILSRRSRGQLTLPNRIVNCVSLELSPGIIQYTNPIRNKVHHIDLTTTPTPRPKPNLDPNPKPIQSRLIHSLEDLLSDFSKNLDDPAAFFSTT